MSRNLGTTVCDFCGAGVVLLEAEREVTCEEVGAYWDDYRGMRVAKAECHACLALYLAWLKPAPGWPSAGHMVECKDGTPFDLSFYHSFNDEPDERDLPRYDVKRQWVRTGPFSGSPYLRLGPVKQTEVSKAVREHVTCSSDSAVFTKDVP